VFNYEQESQGNEETGDPVWDWDRDRKRSGTRARWLGEGAEGYATTSNSVSIDEFGEHRGIEEIRI